MIISHLENLKLNVNQNKEIKFHLKFYLLKYLQLIQNSSISVQLIQIDLI